MRQVRLVALVGGFVLQGLLLARFFGFTADDAFITARYSENLVDTGALEFNRGERVNALTSPLHAALGAVAYGATGRTIPAAKILGVVAVVATCAIALRHLRRRSRDDWLFAALVLPSPFLALWTVGGMETPYLFTTATLAAVRSRESEAGLSRIDATVFGILLGLCFLLRYDAIMFAAPVGLAALLRHRHRALFIVLPGLLLGVGWLALSRWYFGDVMPTSFYVKTPSLRHSVGNGGYVGQFMLLTGIGLAGLGAAAEVLGRRGQAASVAWTAATGSWGIYAGLLLVLIYGLGAATAHMMFGYRLLVPYLAVLVFAVLDLRGIAATGRVAAVAGSAGSSWGAVVALWSLHLGLAWTLDHRSLNPGIIGEYRRTSVRDYVCGFVPALEAAANDVREHWKRQAAGRTRGPRVWTFAAGVLPYELPDAYVFEGLVSFRKNCRPDVRRSADYLHLLAPHHGPVEAQLPGPREDFVLVSDRPLAFEGASEHSLVYFNPRPQPNPLPPRVDGVCPERGRLRPLARAPLAGGEGDVPAETWHQASGFLQQ